MISHPLIGSNCHVGLKEAFEPVFMPTIVLMLLLVLLLMLLLVLMSVLAPPGALAQRRRRWRQD